MKKWFSALEICSCVFCFAGCTNINEEDLQSSNLVEEIEHFVDKSYILATSFLLDSTI